MIKCFFVNVKSIFCDVPRSNFVESELEQLADFILQTDGLIRPLILKEIGVQQYAVIRGHREYYGAVIAKERDLKKAEMVNAFIIESGIEQAAIAQLKLLSKDLLPIPNPSILPETKEKGIEQLLPVLASIISQQLQPLHQELARVTSQLDEHKNILESLKLSVVIDSQPIIEPQPIIESQPIIEPQPIINGSPIDKTANILNLINTLSPTDLSLKMQQIRITKAVTLATSIIAARNKQPDKKFDRWETLISEVKGLGTKTAQTIIDKLH
jgi:hypothetical protein